MLHVYTHTAVIVATSCPVPCRSLLMCSTSNPALRTPSPLPFPQVFCKARASSPCVVFFDEIDAVAVGHSASTGTDVFTRVVSQLLHELDGIRWGGCHFRLSASQFSLLPPPSLSLACSVHK